MIRISEYYIGKPCKMDIGADGEIHWAIGRIVGKAEGAIELKPFNHPSIVEWSTPHGSIFETSLIYLYEVDENDKIILREYEKQAKENKDVNWYGNRLNNISYDIFNYNGKRLDI